MDPESEYEQGSISELLISLKDGDSEAEMEIWRRYFPKLCSLTRAKFGAHPRAVANEEDIAVSVFDLLYRGAKEDRFRKLDSRLDLWRLLVIIASSKVTDQIRRDLAKKRGGGVRISALLEDVIPESPAAEDLVTLQETCEVLFSKLDDMRQRRIASLRLEGYSKQEVADELGISLRTVERKLDYIYDMWVSHVAG